MTVRPATAADLPAIAAIQKTSLAASQWDPADYLNYDCLVATFHTRPEVLGFLVSRQVAADEREILNLAVEPAERRRGIASALLKAELARGRYQWFLEVRESNLGAIRLYESTGFRRSGRREKYYGNPAEPGIVMKFES